MAVTGVTLSLKVELPPVVSCNRGHSPRSRWRRSGGGRAMGEGLVVIAASPPKADLRTGTCVLPSPRCVGMGVRDDERG